MPGTPEDLKRYEQTAAEPPAEEPERDERSAAEPPAEEPERDERSAAEPPAEEPERAHAAALQYTAGEHAPHVIASGRGEVANKIIAAARDVGVPVRQDPALARALTALDLGAEVPEALYRAVAETLAWAYGLDVAAANAAKSRPR